MKRMLPLLLAVSSCASAASVTLHAGQTGQLGDQKITVLSVRDSRCQPGTQCIRAGEIVAKVLVSGRKLRFLTLQFPEAKNTVWAGVRLSEATFERQPKLTFSDEKTAEK